MCYPLLPSWTEGASKYPRSGYFLVLDKMMLTKCMCRFAYCVEFGFNVSTFTSFFDMVHESLQVLFHLVLVGGMFINKYFYFHISLMDGCNCHNVRLLIIQLNNSLCLFIKILLARLYTILPCSIWYPY